MEEVGDGEIAGSPYGRGEPGTSQAESLAHLAEEVWDGGVASDFVRHGDRGGQTAPNNFARWTARTKAVVSSTKTPTSSLSGNSGICHLALFLVIAFSCLYQGRAKIGELLSTGAPLEALTARPSLSTGFFQGAAGMIVAHLICDTRPCWWGLRTENCVVQTTLPFEYSPPP